MKWKVKFSSQAEKYYYKLPAKIREHIKNELTNLSDLPFQLSHPEVKSLIGKLKGFYRLRVGKYRIIFGVLIDEKIIAVVNVYPRGDVYKK